MKIKFTRLDSEGEKSLHAQDYKIVETISSVPTVALPEAWEIIRKIWPEENLAREILREE